MLLRSLCRGLVLGSLGVALLGSACTIDEMVAIDPSTAKSFASKYTKDPDVLVAAAAKKAVPAR